MQCASVNAKENEAGESPPLPASNVPQRSRLRRTLLFAGVFALLAMIWVPTPKYGYRLILDRSDTSIAFFQLLANVAFAALVGAIAANLPKRALYVIGACIAIGVIAFFLKQGTRYAVECAQADERYANGMLKGSSAKEAARYFHHAALNWRLALNFGTANEVDERARDIESSAAEIDTGIAARIRVREEAARIEAKNVPDWAQDQVIAAPNAFDDLIPGAEPRKYVSTDANAGFDPDAYLASKSGGKDIFDRVQWEEEEKLIHDSIDYQTGNWATGAGKAFAVAKFFERNLGDRKHDLDALSDQLGAQKRYTLIEKQKRGGVWWVRVFLYRQPTQGLRRSDR